MSKTKTFFNKKNMQYLEGIVYIFFIIVVIFANTYGSIYITMIPLLVTLGVVGKLVFDRPVITTVFGIVVSLCIVYTKGQVSIFENILLSLSAGLNIALGELLGKYLKLTYKCVKKKRKKLRSDHLKVYIFTVVLSIVTLVLHVYINGDYFDFVKCKKSLANYIEKTYGKDAKFEIVSAKYNFLRSRNFVFKIRNAENDDMNKFTIYLKDTKIVDDAYKEILLAKNNNELNNNLQLYIINSKIKSDFVEYEIAIHYTEITKIELAISRSEKQVNDNEIAIFARDIVNIMQRLQKFNEYEKIEQMQISMKSESKKDSRVSTIFMTDYNELIEQNIDPYEYVIDSLEVEYIDQQ